MTINGFRRKRVGKGVTMKQERQEKGQKEEQDGILF